MAAPQPGHLRLERRKANLHFASWRLANDIARGEGAVALPAPAAPPQAADTDYVTSRHAALLNALTQQPRGCYAFLEGGGGGAGGAGELQLAQVDLGEHGQAPRVRPVCGVPPQRAAGPAGGLIGGSLPPSVVEVQGGEPLAEADAGASPSGDASLLLVSSGAGDLSLVARTAAGQQQGQGGAADATLLSPPVFPLRPAPPLQGVRQLHLAAAFQWSASPAAGPQAGDADGSGGSSGGVDVCCVLWAPRPRSERQPSRAEVYAVRLAAQLGGPAGPTLAVREVQLLKVSDLPPHGVLVNPPTRAVLLALQPSAGSVEEEAAAQRAAAAAAGMRPAGGGGIGTGGGGDAMQEGEEDDVSPRTLQAAVARLAAYTSEEPVGALPHQQYADLYREAGADGVGAMGSEPTCTLFTFVPAASAAAEQQAQQAAAAAADGAGSSAQAAAAAAEQQQQQQQQAGQPLLRLAHTLSCQPHKLLTCHVEQAAPGAQEPPTPDTHAPGGAAGGGGAARGSRLLLGLTDDVDCAVVSVSCCSPNAEGGASASAGDAEEAAAGFVIEHAASLPALAYVAAGKVQRKFLLLAPPGGDLAAALVEGSKYAYLYRATGPRQEYGEHQVVDMELPDHSGRGVLGAVLAGGRAGAARLLLLARDGLRVVDM